MLNCVSSGKRLREDNVPERDSLKRPRVADGMSLKRKTLAQKTTKRQFPKPQSLPKAISQGNYRGGLSEYLQKDPKTKNHQLSFNTATAKIGRRTQFETGCMLVLGGSTYQTVGVADSKKKSVHLSAKKMLVTLGVIPPPVKEQNIPNQQATTHGLGAESQGGEDFNQGVGGGSPWTRFLEQQQKQNNVNERWTKAQVLKYREESQEVMWEQIQIILKPNKSMNVMVMKDEFPGPKEKRPRITALRIMLGRKLKKGLVRVEKKGKKSKWLWTLV